MSREGLVTYVKGTSPNPFLVMGSVLTCLPLYTLPTWLGTVKILASESLGTPCLDLSIHLFIQQTMNTYAPSSVNSSGFKTNRNKPMRQHAGP